MKTLEQKQKEAIEAVERTIEILREGDLDKLIKHCEENGNNKKN